MWTTARELAWLHKHIPGFLAARTTRGQQISDWLQDTTAEFVKAFRDRGLDPTEFLFEVRNSSRLSSQFQCLRLTQPPQCLKNWYSYHPNRKEAVKDKSSGPSAAIPLSVLRKRWAPVAIAPWQAYLKLYIAKGSKLYAEIHSNYDNFKVGKASVHAKYSKLFPGLDQAALSTVGPLRFYQAVANERLKHADEAELAAVQDYIKEQHKREVNVHE